MAALTAWIRHSTRLVALVVSFAFAHAAVPPTSSDVKAVFTYNFIGFVKWPATAFESPQSPIVVGVCGDSEMLRLIGHVVEGEKVRDHPVQVMAVKDARQVGLCHVLYIAPGAEEILRSVPRNHSVLTVGESEKFLSKGGVIRFVTDRNRVKLQINLSAARGASLDINSQLLRIAEIIGGPPQ